MTTETAASAGAFWAFSLRLYAAAGAEQALLRLQDENDADVNLLLYILWRAARGYRLDAADLALVEQRIAPWRDQALRPLRIIRRAMKGFSTGVPGAGALRERVKRDELEAERIQQALMQAHAADNPGVPEQSAQAAARAGLTAYAALIGAELSAAEFAILAAAMIIAAPDSSA